MIDRRWLAHYPPYWHYDVLQALLVLSRLGAEAGDPRAGEALELLYSAPPARRPLAAGRLLVAPARHRSRVEAQSRWLTGRRSGPNGMLTLNALRVLKAAASR